MENYFKVVAKCGHVGRNYYYEGAFFVRAKSASNASVLVKKMPRVKHDHKDAIISVEIVDLQQYNEGVQAQLRNPYFNCISAQQQSLYWDQICKHVKPETELQLQFRKYRYEPHLKYLKDSVNEMRVKKPYKRGRFDLYSYLEQEG